MLIIFTLFAMSILYREIVAGDLDSTKEEEGNCDDVEEYLAEGVNMHYFSKKSTWHISVASHHLYLAYAEAFLGRNVKDQTELSKICLKLVIEKINSTSFDVTTSGYNKTIKQVCQAVLNSDLQIQEKCGVIIGSPGTKTTMFGTNSEKDYRDFVILTDSLTYAVIVVCINGIKAYKIVSKALLVPQHVINMVKMKIAAMGFNPNKMKNFPCIGI